MTLLCGQSWNLHGKCNRFLLILFHGRTIFNTLALEQSAGSDLLTPGEGGGCPTAPPPSLGRATGLSNSSSSKNNKNKNKNNKTRTRKVQEHEQQKQQQEQLELESSSPGVHVSHRPLHHWSLYERAQAGTRGTCTHPGNVTTRFASVTTF